MSNQNLMPFVKWAGGKRQLLSKIIQRMPQNYHTYYEPFVGGGAVLFQLHPDNAVINDVNRSLIHTYQTIARSPKDFIACVQKLDKNLRENGKEAYDLFRERYNHKLLNHELDIEFAALLVCINKHCFNGLYRVNSKGLFNVPYNHSQRDSIQEASIMEISDYLKKITILHGDFENACQKAKEKDFIFFDSPYAPLNPTSFASYTKEGFTTKDHQRLALLFDELTKRGCYCMLTNHNTELIRQLYANKGYHIDEVKVKRMINSDGSNRVGKEIIICNYENERVSLKTTTI